MPISRSEVIKRAATIWPLGHVPYSQMTVRNPGWRTDCSGYVSICLDLPRPGLTTVTLVEDGYIREITPDELRPGDFVGHCGPGTGRCAHCPHPSPSRTAMPGFTSTDGTASAASSTSTKMLLDLHG